MTIGVLVVIVAIFFVLGNIMSLKPKISEVRLGDMRLFARKIELHPKLVATPDWLAQHKQSLDAKPSSGQGMMAQYAVMNDKWRLPAKRLLWTGQDWQTEDGSIFFMPDAPEPFLSHLKGLTTKANSVILYWQDEPYVKGFAIKDEQAMKKIEQELMMLKVFLQSVGDEQGLSSASWLPK